jgi:hypothetical protein
LLLPFVLVQGLKVVELLRSFMAKMPENVKAIADPDGFAEKVGPTHIVHSVPYICAF